MQRLVAAARTAGLVHVASADDHELTDDEISESPDFQTTYPPHCLRGTRGARKMPETEQLDPVPITLEPLPERYLAGREFLLLKKSFDVFTNPNTRSAPRSTSTRRRSSSSASRRTSATTRRSAASSSGA